MRDNDNHERKLKHTKAGMVELNDDRTRKGVRGDFFNAPYRTLMVRSGSWWYMV